MMIKIFWREGLNTPEGITIEVNEILQSLLQFLKVMVGMIEGQRLARRLG
jgi:hypothetical protein